MTKFFMKKVDFCRDL